MYSGELIEGLCLYQPLQYIVISKSTSIRRVSIVEGETCEVVETDVVVTYDSKYSFVEKRVSAKMKKGLLKKYIFWSGKHVLDVESNSK